MEDAASRKYWFKENQSFAEQQTKWAMPSVAAHGREYQFHRIIRKFLNKQTKHTNSNNNNSGEGRKFDFHNCHIIKYLAVNKIL